MSLWLLRHDNGVVFLVHASSEEEARSLVPGGSEVWARKLFAGSEQSQKTGIIMSGELAEAEPKHWWSKGGILEHEEVRAK